MVQLRSMKAREIWVGGQNVDVSYWSTMVAEVKTMNLKDDDRIAAEVLR